MTHVEIKKLLDKYNITTLDELEYCLSAFDSNDECIDDPEYNKKDCMNSKCYEEYGVPDCRKIVEIYNKYFQKDIKTKKEFINYLVRVVNKKRSSVENYMSCKSCNQQIEKGIQTSLKISDSDFKKDFCNNLNIKFNYTSLFQTEYKSIKQFLNKEHQVTSDTYIPQYKQSENTMTKDEEKKLFDISHTSINIFQSHLKNEENLKGSFSYLLNLALNAFDRNLVKESNKILTIIAALYNTSYSTKEYLQLKAKIHSYNKEDKKAIEVLNELIQKNQSNIDSETYNLLAASIKREAIEEFEKYSDAIILHEKLIKAKDIYYTVYKLTNSYYPTLNYIYLMKITSYIQQEDKFPLIENATNIWKSINLVINDWWSFIANIEFLLVTEQYEEALSELENHLSDLNKLEISEFNLFSTIRQLELYSKFCDDTQIKLFIHKIRGLQH